MISAMQARRLPPQEICSERRQTAGASLLNNIRRNLLIISDFVGLGVIGNEFRPVFAPARVTDRRFDALSLESGFMIDFVPENFRGIGGDVMKDPAGIIGAVFDRGISAAGQNGGNKKRKQLSSEDAHAPFIAKSAAIFYLFRSGTEKTATY